jgi:uncharacterized protein
MSHETLSKFQRQTLMNQLAILEKLDPTHAKQYQRDQKILESGFTLWYPEVLPHDEVSHDQCEYVHNVLNMFRALDRSYAGLEDKTGIDESDIRFGGFDGNNESDLLSYAEFLYEQGRFRESLKDEDLNSHSMTRNHHDMMLDKFSGICARHGEKWVDNLSKVELQEIIA